VENHSPHLSSIRKHHRGRRYRAAAFRRAAIRTNPNFFDAYYCFARCCFARGQIERSAKLFDMARKIRHEDFQSHILLSQSLQMLGRIEEASEALNEDVHRAENALLLNPLDGRALSLGSGALQEDGQIERALQWSLRSLELYPNDTATLINATCLCARRGLKEEALNLLERVLAKGWGKRDWIEHDPDYDILRDDPRFQNLLAKLK